MARKPFEKRQRTLVSVAPFKAFDEMRSTGYFLLPARKEGERYAKFVVGDVVAKHPLGDKKFMDVIIEADQIADSLINDHEAHKFGCFVAEGPEPTEEELLNAEAKYDEWRRIQVQQADKLWEQYRKNIFISDHAKRSAKELGLKRTWLEDVSRTKQCPNCGSPNLPSQARCQCGAVLDYKLALEYGLLTEREEIRAREKGLLDVPENAKTTQFVTVPDEEAGTF